MSAKQRQTTTTNFRILACFLVISLFISCEKEPGEGGTATITGKVYARNYGDTSGELINEYFAPDERVYIVYGDNIVHDDDVRTFHDGTYQFKNLYRGEYTVFAYSQCDTCQTPDIPISQTINITSRGQYFNVPLITIFK